MKAFLSREMGLASVYSTLRLVRESFACEMPLEAIIKMLSTQKL